MKNYISKFITSNWVITLSATLVGVFLALYLNEQVAINKLNKQKAIASDNLSSEIQENKKSLKNSISSHILLLDTFNFINNYKTKEGDFIVPIDTITAFRKKHPDIIYFKDSIQINSKTVKYTSGEISTNLGIPQISLKSITLETIKNSELITIYSFECLMSIESLLKITAEVRKQNVELFNSLVYLNEMKIKQYDKVIQRLKFLIGYEKGLMNEYDVSDKILKNCN